MFGQDTELPLLDCCYHGPDEQFPLSEHCMVLLQSPTYNSLLIGVVEKPGPGSERVPLVLHGHRIDLTLSSRRRRRIEGRSPSTRSRCPRLSLDTARERAYSG